MGIEYKGISINTTKNTHEKVFGLIKNDNKSIIVDIPSGSGAFVQRLKDAGFSNVKAVDIENILEIEHEAFYEGDMTKELPFPANSCDLVVCIDGIEHISKQFDFISEVNKILKVGGEIIISTPNISSLRSRWKWLTTGHHYKCDSPLDENNPTPLHHIGMVSLPEMRYLLHTNGFHLEKITTNRIKLISWVYILLLPLTYLFTFLVYQKAGKREGTSAINKDVLRTMFSKDVLFGETLIVLAKKIKNN